MLVRTEYIPQQAHNQYFSATRMTSLSNTTTGLPESDQSASMMPSSNLPQHNPQISVVIDRLERVTFLNEDSSDDSSDDDDDSLSEGSSSDGSSSEDSFSDSSAEESSFGDISTEGSVYMDDPIYQQYQEPRGRPSQDTGSSNHADHISSRVRFSPEDPVVHSIERTPPEEMHLIYYSCHELQQMLDESRNETTPYVRFSTDVPVVYLIERTPPEEMHLFFYTAHELQRMIEDSRPPPDHNYNNNDNDNAPPPILHVQFSPNNPVVHRTERTPPDEMHLNFYSGHELQRMIDDSRNDDSTNRHGPGPLMI